MKDKKNYKMDLTDYKHYKQIEIRYDDLDTFNHINNKAYFSYLEEARIDLYNQLFNIKGQLKITAIVAHIEIDYHKPAFYGQTIGVYTKISKIGTKSFELSSVFIVKKEHDKSDEWIASAKVILVSIDPTSGNSVQISDDERLIMNRYLNAKES